MEHPFALLWCSALLVLCHSGALPFWCSAILVLCYSGTLSFWYSAMVLAILLVPAIPL